MWPDPEEGLDSISRPKGLLWDVLVRAHVFRTWHRLGHHPASMAIRMSGLLHAKSWIVQSDMGAVMMLAQHLKSWQTLGDIEMIIDREEIVDPGVMVQGGAREALFGWCYKLYKGLLGKASQSKVRKSDNTDPQRKWHGFSMSGDGYLGFTSSA